MTGFGFLSDSQGADLIIKNDSKNRILMELSQNRSEHYNTPRNTIAEALVRHWNVVLDSQICQNWRPIRSFCAKR